MSTGTVITHTADSIFEYLQIINELPTTSAKTDIFVYRGQSDKAWQFQSGIMRAQHKRFLRYERDAVRELIAVHPAEFDDDRSMFDKLVRMQHFNLPTRLLDVTKNPLVALYFAVENESSTDGCVQYIRVPPGRIKYFDSDTISCVSNLCNLSSEEKQEISTTLEAASSIKGLKAIKRLVHFIRDEKPSFANEIRPSDLETPWLVWPKLSNRRIVAQSGAFVIFGLPPKRPATSTNAIRVRGIEIPSSSKRDIKQNLDRLGINRSALFPEIDQAAKYIIDRYR